MAEKGTGETKSDLLLEQKKEDWRRIQNELKLKMREEDEFDWQKLRQVCDCESDTCARPTSHLRYCGGVDISFKKDDADVACATLVVYDLKKRSVLYDKSRAIRMTEPYIPGFLAFREIPPIAAIMEELKVGADGRPFPQVILVDGNGKLHSNEFGLACQLGVTQDVCTVGVAKNLHFVHGLERDETYHAQIESLKRAGDRWELKSKSHADLHLGCALRTTDNSTKPVFVSVGHRISLDTAVWVVMACAQHRVPEPTRHADIISREFLRKE